MESEYKLTRNHYIVLVVVFTEVLGFSMAIPVIPFLGLELGLNAFQIGLILSTYSIAQFFGSPIIGKFSDRYGRKKMLIISQFSTFIGFMMLGIADSVLILVAARLIDGLFGANMTLAQTVLSDLTPNQHKTVVFGYSSAVFGGGFIFGPAIGGYLASFSFGLPFFLAAAISFVSIIFVLFVLPETLDKKEEASLKIRDVFPILEMKRFARMPMIRNALLLLVMYNGAFFIYIANQALFFEAKILADTREVGLLLAWIGVLRVMMQSTIIAPLISRIGEYATHLSGVFFLIISMVLLMITPNFLFSFIPLALIAYGSGVIRPILTSNLTNTVEQNETGTLLGINNSLVSIVQIISPTLGGYLLTTTDPASLPLASGGMYILLFILSILLFKLSKSE